MTGCTIGCVRQDDGSLAPGTPEQFERLLANDILKDQTQHCDIVHLKTLIDSSAGNPHHWEAVGTIVAKFAPPPKAPGYAGFVVIHGTDTLAYMAAGLEWLLMNVSSNCNVVVTGSQIPLSCPGSDGWLNLHRAIELARHDTKTQVVTIVFGHQVIEAVQAVKMCATALPAFTSANGDALGYWEAGGLKLNNVAIELIRKKHDERRKNRKVNGKKKEENEGKPKCHNAIPDVALVCLYPAFHPSILLHLVQNEGVRGIVLEAFGAGNGPLFDRDEEDTGSLRYALETVLGRGVLVVYVTQCFSGSTIPVYGVSLDKIKSTYVDAEGNEFVNTILRRRDCTSECALAQMATFLAYKPSLNRGGARSALEHAQKAMGHTYSSEMLKDGTFSPAVARY